MLKSFAAPLAVALAGMFLLAVLGALSKKRKPQHSEIKARTPLTAHEQTMYFRLRDALPEYIVLCQVSFSALLDTGQKATRNTFDRKIADFVICRQSFGVVAVVELDDSSHKGRERQDASRDALLTNAGYKVLRYKRVPETEAIRADLKAAFEAKTAKAEASPAAERKEPTT